MAERPLTISQIYAKGQEKLTANGYKRLFAPNGLTDATIRANRKCLDSIFFRTKFLDPVAVDTSLTLFGVKLKAPVFCTALSGFKEVGPTSLTDIALGLKNAGSLMMLGMGLSADLQRAIDTGVPAVKIVKPYRKTELIYEKIRDAENRGCVAVGIDIDHSYGALMKAWEGNEFVQQTENYGPLTSDTLKQIVSATKLPFIVKGVLGVQDAQKAAQIGASAIIVSAHGFSTVDYTVPPIVALPEIVQAVGDKVTVLIDTGFKTGNDVLKALALGAKAVGFASSMFLAWGAGGSGEVENLINQIRAELSRTMASTGCSNVSAVSRSVITQIPGVQPDI